MQSSYPAHFEFDPQKFDELLLSIALGQQDHPMPDFTKVNKAMYLIDFASFRDTGQPVTGADYLHYSEGPVPLQTAPRINHLFQAGHIEPRTKTHILGNFRYPHVPSRIPNLELFTHQQRDLIQQALDLLKHRTPAEATTLFERDPGWAYTTTGLRIPYEAVHAANHSVPGFRTEASPLELSPNRFRHA